MSLPESSSQTNKNWITQPKKSSTTLNWDRDGQICDRVWVLEIPIWTHHRLKCDWNSTYFIWLLKIKTNSHSYTLRNNTEYLWNERSHIPIPVVNLHTDSLMTIYISKVFSQRIVIPLQGHSKSWSFALWWSEYDSFIFIWQHP